MAHDEQPLLDSNSDTVSTDSLQRRISYEMSKADINQHERTRPRQHGCPRKLGNTFRWKGRRFQSSQESTLDSSTKCFPEFGTNSIRHSQQRERRPPYGRSGQKLRITFRRKASRFTSSLELLLESHTGSSESHTGSMYQSSRVSATRSITEFGSVSSRSWTESSSIRSLTESSTSFGLSPSIAAGQRRRQQISSLARKSGGVLSNWARKAGKVAEKSKQSWEKMRTRSRGGCGVKVVGSGHGTIKTIRRIERRHGSCVVVRERRHVQLVE